MYDYAPSGVKPLMDFLEILAVAYKIIEGISEVFGAGIVYDWVEKRL